MALTFPGLMAFLTEAEVKFLIAPDLPMLAITLATPSGRTFLLHATIEAEGTLLQLRTNGYLVCPPSSPFRDAVLRLLNELNFKLRIVKFCLDAGDGEVVVYADLAVMDSTPTITQVMALTGFVMERVRETAGRIEAVITTGLDPEDKDIVV
jgi:hypothetical protein